MKYYIIAGEASGDLHASNLIKEIIKLDPLAVIRGWGGDLMKQNGTVLVKHYKDTAFMGFTEVLIHLKSIMRNINECKKDILHFNPDALILVDYPGFNLRIAEFASQNKFNVYYYISPQVWAWKQSRVKQIKKFVRKMFVILPFEKEFYAKNNYSVEFVGHPLLDVINETSHPTPPKQTNEKPIITLLPGSRTQEIQNVLPIMLEVIPHFANYRFMIGGLSSIEKSFYQNIIQGKNVDIVFDQTYDLIRQAEAALVTSGTASLETALFGVSEVVCYKGSSISYLIAKKLVGKNIRFISLVNLIMNKEIVTELIQHQLTKDNLIKELTLLLHDETKKQHISAGYFELKKILGGQGASKKTAEIIHTDLINK